LTDSLIEKPAVRHKLPGIRGRPKNSPRVKNDPKVEHDPKAGYDPKVEHNPNAGHDPKVEQARQDLKDEHVPPPSQKRKRSLDRSPPESLQLSQAQRNAPYHGSQTSNSAHIPGAEHPITTSASLGGYYSTERYFYGDSQSWKSHT